MLLRTELSEGRFDIGAQIPTERELTERFAVSRITIRQAIDSLVQEGVLMRQQGRGTFVLAPPPRSTVTEFAGTLDVIETLGQSTDVRVLSTEYVPCPSRIAQDLRIETPQVHLLKVLRVRSSRGEPFEHLTNWVSPILSTQINPAELERRSLVSLLKERGVKVDAADQIVSATLTTPEVSEFLETPVGSPLLQGHRIYYAGGTPVMVLESLYRPDRYAYRVRLSAADPLLSEVWVSQTGQPRP